MMNLQELTDYIYREIKSDKAKIIRHERRSKIIVLIECDKVSKETIEEYIRKNCYNDGKSPRQHIKEDKYENGTNTKKGDYWEISLFNTPLHDSTLTIVYSVVNDNDKKEKLIKIIEETMINGSEFKKEVNSYKEILEQAELLIAEHDKEVKKLKQERDDWQKAFYHAGLCIEDTIRIHGLCGDEITDGILAVMERLGGTSEDE